ncbi:hypothetical protein AMAG_12453 [Allomyces macrogynus ATCC 38327]|uniref:Cytochrome P450 n=1 Tax=Allomyces macrogynus (strain ATCC 38327) TaxID=578462 RepID=A0A0L0SYZ1_ALLM3|nr:hypothetical protein AMAG_12453 [Allomyces macrogynus ATCC 38327]|eukprot:KNE67722.1 hypothetical protein AMAG_12453 [Allomyces macrogynus ATCC 38327]
MDAINMAQMYLSDVLVCVQPAAKSLARATTPRRVTAAAAVVGVAWAAHAFYTMLVPPRHLRKYTSPGIWTTIRAFAANKGYVEQREVFEEHMLQDALKRGLVKSRDDPPMPVYMIWIMGYYLVIVQNPEDVKLILTDHDNFDKIQFGLGYTDRLFGDNIVFSQTAEWKQQRKVVNPAFRRGWATSLFGTPARNLVKKLDEYAASGAIMDPAEWTQRMALDALTLAAFGDNIDSINHPNAPIVVMYNTLMAESADLGKLLNPFYKWSKDGKHMLALIEQFDQFIFDMIDTKTAELAAKRAAGLQDGDQDARNLLEMMIEAAEGTDFSREDLRANTVIFFVAGHDTTANALSFAIYLLGMHPEVQERARQEVISIMGDANPSTPAEEMLYPTTNEERSMAYLTCVIKETMRLFPSLAALPHRITTAPVTLHDGTVLPKGTRVTADLYSLHRNRAVWGPGANEFKPERWLFSVGPDGQVPMHPGAANFAWAPFGGGQRICMGQQFSLVEQRVVLAMLLLRYTWTVVGDDKALAGKPEVLPGTLLHPVGVQVKLVRRGVE